MSRFPNYHFQISFVKTGNQQGGRLVQLAVEWSGGWTPIRPSHQLAISLKSQGNWETSNGGSQSSDSPAEWQPIGPWASGFHTSNILLGSQLPSFMAASRARERVAAEKLVLSWRVGEEENRKRSILLPAGMLPLSATHIWPI